MCRNVRAQRGMLGGGMAVQRAVLLDIGQHAWLVFDVAALQRALEERVDEVEHAIGTIRLFDAVLEGQREDRLDAGRALGEDADPAGGRDGGTRGVAQRRPVLVDTVLPVREGAAYLGQLPRFVGGPL